MFDKWNEVDTKCEHCGAVTKKVRGITKQNMKRLLIPRWDWSELTITFLMLMILVIALLYNHDVKICHDWAGKFGGTEEQCKVTCNSFCTALRVYNNSYTGLNWSGQINLSKIDDATEKINNISLVK